MRREGLLRSETRLGASKKSVIVFSRGVAPGCRSGGLSGLGANVGVAHFSFYEFLRSIIRRDAPALFASTGDSFGRIEKIIAFLPRGVAPGCRSGGLSGLGGNVRLAHLSFYEFLRSIIRRDAPAVFASTGDLFGRIEKIIAFLPRGVAPGCRSGGLSCLGANVEVSAFLFLNSFARLFAEMRREGLLRSETRLGASKKSVIVLSRGVAPGCRSGGLSGLGANVEVSAFFILRIPSLDYSQRCAGRVCFDRRLVWAHRKNLSSFFPGAMPRAAGAAAFQASVRMWG